MILVIHIAVALATLASSVGSVMLANRSLIRSTPPLLGGTIASGVVLLMIYPGVSVLHLCISGLALSVVTIVLHRLAIRRLATA